ncbi:MAG: ribosome silencing factor [Clostridia bacterium]|nr:ribosome silencing factor [Clostridia bacterium]
MESKELCTAIVQSLDKHKGADIQVLYISDLTSITDYFVIVEGTSSTHVKSLSDYVEVDMEEKGIRVHHKEGYNGSAWVLLDYGNVVVHVFQPEAREYYNLERLWKDGKAIDLSEFGVSTDNA